MLIFLKMTKKRMRTMRTEMVKVPDKGNDDTRRRRPISIIVLESERCRSRVCQNSSVKRVLQRPLTK